MHHLLHSSATQYTKFLLHFCGFSLCINEQFNLSILGAYTYKLWLFIIVFYYTWTCPHLFIYLSFPFCFHLYSLMVYLSDWFLCPPTFSPLIHYFCTTPHRGAVTHYVVHTALFTGFGHVHAGIIRFSASPCS